MADTWTTIESDPGVFTVLISEMGVNGVQVRYLFPSTDTPCYRTRWNIKGRLVFFSF